MASKEPEIIRDKNQMRNWSRSMRSQGKTIGLVPTMGYLHDGHLSLIRQAHSLSDVIVVSIYVNPGQFSPFEDLSTYPSDFHGDIQKLNSVLGGVDVVFNPHNLYDYGTNTSTSVSDGGEAKLVSCVEEKGLGHETWVRVERLEKGMCGKSRPVFFRGVATVVTKLFNVVEPDVALFGKKDYQQWRIIQRMVRDLDFSVRVIGFEIVRENDGLAMSSRNVRLSREEREKALSIYKSLSRARCSAEKGHISCKELTDLVIQVISEAGGRVDYAEIVDQESLEPVEEIRSPVVFCIAAWFGSVRLIDNMEIKARLISEGKRLAWALGFKWEFHYDLWTEIGSLSFASRSIWWDPELKKLNRMMENKFGRVSADTNFQNKPRVHEQLKLLSTEPATVEKLETVKKIAKKENNNWYSDTDSENRDCLDFMMPTPPTPPAPHIHQFTPDYDNIYNSLKDLKNYYNVRLK